jgi:opacity protein-like surface antigen
MVTRFISILLSLLFAAGAAAQPASAPDRAGFYGGVMLRNAAVEGPGLAFGPTVSAWTRFAPAIADESSNRTLLFGGYRFHNNIAVEAAFNSTDRYALRPRDEAPQRRGVGLDLASGTLSPADAASWHWNVDVFTSWTFYRSVALYGRLGYGQAEGAPAFGLAAPTAERRVRDGMNYGLGLRYDMNASLGLRLEYGRYGRYTGDLAGGLLESDQVSVGLQFRF